MNELLGSDYFQMAVFGSFIAVIIWQIFGIHNREYRELKNMIDRADRSNIGQIGMHIYETLRRPRIMRNIHTTEIFRLYRKKKAELYGEKSSGISFL
jgi:hypothetical protein